MAGQISGLITELKPVADILEDTWSQAEDLLN
jgi:enoyl-[acyl-carrier protein] reductase II